MIPTTDAEWREYYRRLTTAELEDVAAHVRREEWPVRAAMVDEELRLRATTRRPQVDDEGVFGPELAELRQARRVLFIMFLSFLPLQLLVGVPLSRAFGSAVPSVVLGFAYMLPVAVYDFRFRRLRCPRCSERMTTAPMFGGLLTRNVAFTGKCMHCGFGKPEG